MGCGLPRSWLIRYLPLPAGGAASTQLLKTSCQLALHLDVCFRGPYPLEDGRIITSGVYKRHGTCLLSAALLFTGAALITSTTATNTSGSRWGPSCDDKFLDLTTAKSIERGNRVLSLGYANEPNSYEALKSLQRSSRPTVPSSSTSGGPRALGPRKPSWKGKGAVNLITRIFGLFSWDLRGAVDTMTLDRYGPPKSDHGRAHRVHRGREHH